jgi:hypothetical protein
MIESGCEFNVSVDNTLSDMSMKSGIMDYARMCLAISSQNSMLLGHCKCR